MKLVVIFGPQAVGKMTVGHELEKIKERNYIRTNNTNPDAAVVAQKIKETFKL